MARPNWNLVRTLLARTLREPAAVADADLLDRYRATQDAAAFELLVRRYADLVFGVCRRVCRDEHDAEDAFQATFLILAKKAHSVRSNLAGWLHRTARRAAMRASQRRNRIYTRETSMIAEPAFDADDEIRDLRPVLDAEIDRLPERLRLAVLACYVEGRTTEDAASLFGVPRGTILSRLSKARDLLAARLTRRGITAATLTAALAPETASASLVAQTAATFLLPAAGSAVELLSLEVLRMSAWKTTTVWAAALILTAGLGTGTSIIMAQGEKPARQAPPVNNVNNQKPDEAPRVTPPSPRSTKIKELEERLTQQSEEQAKLRDQLSRVRREHQIRKISQMDPGLLMNAIRRIDEERLELQSQQDAMQVAIKDAARKLEQIADFKPEDDVVHQKLLLRPEFEQLDIRKRDLGQRIQKIADPNEIAKLNEQMQGISTERTTLTEKLRPEIIAYFVDREKLSRKLELERCKSEVAGMQTMDDLKRTRRKSLEQQLAESVIEDDPTERLERDIARTDRIVEELSRKLIFLKADIEEDSSRTSLDKLAREVAELKAEIKKLSGKK